ncbi:MAG: transglutaminase-like domain-containing protein [Bacteroidales bacterium]|nr:transglutaminase-like domain-containing protein [Bacteroidales bacterium]
MNDNEINALINLLDDPDKQVSELVTQKISERGIELIPKLEKAWELAINQEFQQKIEDMIQFIQFENIKTELNIWKASSEKDLLNGAFLIAKYQYPDLEFSEIQKQIEKIRKDVWLEIHQGLTALEKVKIMNHILFSIHRFNKNASNFYSPGNSFINQVLETKKGNPISLSVIYSSIAQSLDMPVYGVNLPLNYVLAYVDPYYVDDPDGILFYINPYQRGTILNRKDINLFLERQQLEKKPEYFKPCTNEITIERMLRNLLFSYEKIGYKNKLSEINELINIIKETES